MNIFAAGLLALALQVTPQAGAQDTIPAEPPSDTYADPGVEELLNRARVARAEEVEGIESYEALMKERIYVGLSAFRFRRERSLFQQQRAARYRWSRDGDRVVQWLGARRQIPLVEGQEEAMEEIDRELADELMREVDPGPLAFDPWDERLVFADSWAVHPLSDSAGVHYRFLSGDTLRVALPGDQGEIVMIEARVQPRRDDFHLMAGSLWFDQASGSLVRASFRPARPFDLEIEEPEDAEEVPGIFKPIIAEVDYITVDYSLHEFRWWLPRRFGFEGEVKVGRMLAMPLTFEWTVGQYAVNEESQIPAVGELPPGWSRTERRTEVDGRPVYTTIVIPPQDSLLQSAELLDADLGTTPVAFSEAELKEIRDELDSLIPSPIGLNARWSYGFQDAMTRYNRIEALSTGIAVEADMSRRTTVGGSARLGFDLQPNGELFVRRGTREEGSWVGAFRRLDYVNEREDPFGLGASALSLAFGYEDAQFYRSLGAEAGIRARTRGSRRSFRLFYEHQSAAEKTTDFNLTGLITGDDMRPNIIATELDVVGGEVGLDWQWGLDPRGLIASGSIRAEAAWGFNEAQDGSPSCIPETPPEECDDTVSSSTRSYQRAWGSVAMTHPLFWGLAGAIELGAGAAFGDVTVQREFYLGGYSNLRGFYGGEVFGTGAWLGRIELANDLPVARFSVFSDVGWAGDREEWTFEDPYVNVGAGASLVDGLVRFDIARAVRRGDAWRIHFYLDGLF
jgi:hypothetical protein